MGGSSTGKGSIVRTYLIFAVVLCLITFAEWAVFKMEHSAHQPYVLVPTLLGLSLVKFVMVAGWYMHLRFDHGWLWKMFVIAGLMSTATFFVVKHCL